MRGPTVARDGRCSRSSSAQVSQRERVLQVSQQVSDQIVALAAGVQTANVLAGTQLEYMQYNAKLILGCTGGGSGVRVSLQVGNDVVIDDQLISDLTRWPISPDDFLQDTGSRKGDRNVLRFRNTSGAARTINFVVKALPVIG